MAKLIEPNFCDENLPLDLMICNMLNMKLRKLLAFTVFQFLFNDVDETLPIFLFHT